MMTSHDILGYFKAEPFRPFRIQLSSGRTFEIHHPEMIKVLKNHALVFKAAPETPELPDEWESISLLLTESISHLEPSVR